MKRDRQRSNDPTREGGATDRIGLALLAAAAVVALAGCGGSKAPSVASIATTTTPASSAAGTSASSGAGTSGSSSQAELQQASLKYARCMRANGVPGFPDPNAGGGFSFQPGAGIDPSSPAFEAAQVTCRKLLPGGGPPGPGTATHPSPQWLAQMVKAAQCMRRHGISDFPDPRTSVPSDPFPAGAPGGVISDIDGVILIFPASIDMQSPAFVRAAAACKFPLHNH